MSSSFVEYRDNGFWSNDRFLEVIQICLINQIELEGLDSIEWINLYKAELAFQALPFGMGMVSMELDEFLTDEERKQTIVSLIDRILNRIVTDSNYLTGDNMHLFRTRAMRMLNFENEDDFLKEVNSSNWAGHVIPDDIKDNYIHAFKLLMRLIIGDLIATAGSPIDYWPWKYIRRDEIDSEE